MVVNEFLFFNGALVSLFAFFACSLIRLIQIQSEYFSAPRGEWNSVSAAEKVHVMLSIYGLPTCLHACSHLLNYDRTKMYLWHSVLVWVFSSRLRLVCFRIWFSKQSHSQSSFHSITKASICFRLSCHALENKSCEKNFPIIPRSRLESSAPDEAVCFMFIYSCIDLLCWWF